MSMPRSPSSASGKKSSVSSRKGGSVASSRRGGSMSSRRGTVRARESLAASIEPKRDRKDIANNLRKNKAYQQLKRDLEQRQRNRAKQDPVDNRQEVIYVDRDRAAAVQMGTKDIKNDLRHKKRRDRMENAQNATVEDEIVFGIYMAQGEHELKCGDAHRALRYFNKAHSSGCLDEDLFTLRCQCHLKLGHFAAAHEDAQKVLEMNPRSTKGLIVIAEAEYHVGNFEHALKFFYRANFIRPEYNGVRQGINKSRDAVENSLSKTNGFSFSQMDDVIHLLLKEGGLHEDEQTVKMKKLGYVDAFGQDGFSQEEDESSDQINKQEQEAVIKFDDGKNKRGKTRPEDKMFISLGMTNIIGLVQPQFTKDDVVVGMLAKFDSARDDEMAKQKVMERRRQRRLSILNDLRLANKQLLGKFHADQLYLEKLLSHPHMKSSVLGNSSEGEGVDVVQKKIRCCAQEALDFLSSRKDFWQQQKPVYARKNELVAKRNSIYNK